MKKIILALIITTISLASHAENCAQQFNTLESAVSKRLPTNTIIQTYWDISADMVSVGNQLLRASQNGSPVRDPREIDDKLSGAYSKIKSTRDHAYVYSSQIFRAYDSLLECAKVTSCSSQVNAAKGKFNGWVGQLKFTVDYHFEKAERTMNELKQANLTAYRSGREIPYFESHNLKTEGENLSDASNEDRNIFESYNRDIQNSINSIKGCLYL